VFISDAQLRAQLGRTWMPMAVALIVLLLVGLQITASLAGFRGPLVGLISDYVATPKSSTVPWVGLGVAMVGLSNRCRISALSAAAALDVVFAAERMSRGGAFSFGNGPLIVLTGLAVMVAWQRWARSELTTAARGVAFGLLLVIATEAIESWLRVTAIVRPKVFDEYALLADYALGQPSWLVGRLVEAAGPVPNAALHWVYIELPLAAMVVAIYQLRNVRTAGWPPHFLVPTFLVLSLVGPVIYLLFPVVGPEFAFGSAGRAFRVGDYWPHLMPPILSPRPLVFDGFTPRNCMPSMHTAWALAIFLHSRGGPRWLRWGGALWLVCTIGATLGFGYHYGVDLVAGAVLCMTVDAALRNLVRGRVWSWLAVLGAALLAVLLVCCRYLAAAMASYPLFFGPLIVGALAIFSTAFYATFFAPSALIEVRSSLSRSSVAARQWLMSRSHERGQVALAESGANRDATSLTSTPNSG
jgi:hypothetical protein